MIEQPPNTASDEPDAPMAFTVEGASWPYGAAECAVCGLTLAPGETGLYGERRDPTAPDAECPDATYVFHLRCAAQLGGRLLKTVDQLDPSILDDCAAEARDEAAADGA